LKGNTKLATLDLTENEAITVEGARALRSLWGVRSFEFLI